MSHTEIPTNPPDALAATQRWIQQSLLFPRRVDPRELEARLLPSAQLDAASRLAVYQRGYVLRLLECLHEQFPALRHALGEELFGEFCREYLRACPSDSYTLYELGRRLAEHLEGARPDRDLPPESRETWIDFMVDLARYERDLFRLFDAPGHEGRPWPSHDVPDSALVLQPCFSLGEYRYGVAWYYHSIREHPDCPLPPRRDSFVAIARRDYATATFPISQVHFWFLQHLRESRNIEESLVYIAKRVGRSLAEVTRAWRDEVRAVWLESGFFVEREGEPRRCGQA